MTIPPERPPLPDGHPDPIELSDFEPPEIDTDLDWQSPDYRGVRRTRTKRVKKPHWYRPRNTLAFPALAIVLLLLIAVLYVNAQMSGIRRAPLLPDFGGRGGAGTNVLLVASNSSEHSLASDPRTMVIQLVHVSADGADADVVNLPTDLYLPDAGTSAKHRGSRRLVDAYRSAGIPRVATMVQSALGINIDHVAQVGFAGYVRVTDRLGGVDMPSDQGLRHFTGAQAERYTTEDAASSIAAGRANQQWLKAMLTSALTPSVLLNPFTLVGLLRDTKPNLVLDDGFTNGALRGLLWRSRHLRPSSIRFVTVPYVRYATRTMVSTTTKADGKEKKVRTRAKVLLPDVPGLEQLGAAVRIDNDSGVAVFDH